MTSRFAARALSGPMLVGVLSLVGCASRSLNTTPVEDWSGGAHGRAPATSTAGQTYAVRRDDTLSSIARRFNTTPAELSAWNSLGANPRLRVDQVLRVSAPVAPPSPAGDADGGAPVAVAQPVGNERVEQRSLGSEPVASPSGPMVGGAPPSAPVPSSGAPMKTGPLGAKRPYSEAALAELSRPDADVASGTAVGPAPNAAPASAAAPVVAGAPVAAPMWAWPSAGKATGTFDGKNKGIDIGGTAGDAVLAAADGKVTFAGAGVRGYGNFVIIRHSPDLLSVYAHNRANLVKEGAVVTRGQKIAEMGNSDTDAVKLHFEIRNDSKPVDPLKYLPER